MSIRGYQDFEADLKRRGIALELVGAGRFRFNVPFGEEFTDEDRELVQVHQAQGHEAV